MALFSERYGYIKPSEVIIRERISPEIQNAICSCFDRLEAAFHEYEKSTFNMEHSHYENLEKFLWTDFLNKREKSFYTKGGRYVVATSFIEGDSKWFLKLDLIEKTLKYLSASSNFAYRKIKAAKADDWDQKYLQAKKDDPILELEQIVWLNNGQPVEYSTSRNRYDERNYVVLETNSF